MTKLNNKTLAHVRYMHRCTQVENLEKGVAQIFAKFPGGQGIRDKIAKGSTILGSITFKLYFYSEVFENLPGGSCAIPPNPPPPPL